MIPGAESLRRIGGALLGTALAALFTWIIIKAVNAEPAVAGSIIASIATAAGAVGAVAYQQSRVEREKIRERHRERMEPIYEEFVDRAAARFAAGDRPMSTDEVSFFAEFNRKNLLLRADPAVIQAFNAWVATAPSEANPNGPALAYERLLAAIREDLGHSDCGLRQKDLLRLFSDIDKDEAAAGGLAPRRP
jgi:hypothetical protein